MASQVTYGYDISMSFILGKKEKVIEQEQIQQVIVSYDYEKTFAPIIYAHVNIPVAIYNSMQKNTDKGKVLLDIKRYNDKDKTKAKKSYIKNHFIYFFSEIDYDTDADDKDIEDTEKHNSYRDVYIGLLDIDIINDYNKKLMNQIFLKSNTVSIIHYFTKKTKIVIEPFDYNDKLDVVVVPPIIGINNLLEYLDQMRVFYKTGFRYFRDFHRSYILSNKGKGIAIKGSKAYKSVHINVERKKDNSNVSVIGQVNDKKKKCYIIQVNPEQCDIKLDRYSDLVYNQIIGVNLQGDENKKKTDVNKIKKSTVKRKVIKEFNKNSKFITEEANVANLAGTVVTITKSDINCDIITPHKEFIINHETINKSKNGNYILANKREVFAKKDSEGFGVNVIATFKKVYKEKKKE